MKVIIDDKIPFINGVLEPFADVVYMSGGKISNKDLKDIDALIIRTRTQCNATLLEGTKVKFIASATIGHDHIDKEYCESHNIFWTSAPGCNATSVMQYVASALLFYARERNINLNERVMGVIGVGNVGRKIVKLAEILGLQVFLNDPPRAEKEGPCGYISIDGIIREADIVTFHVPLNRGSKYNTYHLAGEGILNRLNKGTLFINTSRGEVMDSDILKREIAENRISDAILDVWENEPDIDISLLDMAFIGTPHIAGYSADGKANGTKMVIRQFSRFFRLDVLDDWEPEEIPTPDNILIHCNGYRKSFQEIVTEVVLKTYNIKDENRWLRNDISRFEDYRGNYPLRREFHAYTLNAENIDLQSLHKLKLLGFKIKD